jgi:ATP-binding protein involved in chromosome partitioning
MNHTATHQAGAPSASPQSGPEKLPGIRHIVAIGSGKGGVGKSTVSVNLALVLQRLGGRIGLVDADVLGPSIPGMLGIPSGRPPAATPDGKAIPAERHGVKTMSMGMFTGDDTPAVLRGPMVGKYLRMLIGGVQWGPLDYLILDLPPGTGGCQGCTASQLTLKYGFELMVRRVAPEIVDIVDTTDHASGTKPFYQHAGEVR